MALSTELGLSILNSNAVQLVITFAFGASLCLLPVHKIIPPLGVALSAGIFLSFFFIIGEVYIYSDTYRRAFLFFGDNISTILGFIFLYSIAANRSVLALIVLIGVLMSGGKASIILMLVMFALFLVMQRDRGQWLAEGRRLFILFLIGVATYFASQSASLQLMKSSAFLSARASIPKVFAAVGEASEDGDEIPGAGRACVTMANCVETQIESPLRQRYYTSLGGLWMTLQGGFPGKRYPGTPEKFADLMVAANPWDMNDTYDLTWNDWRRMGGVQNPYLCFGSGYGPWALLGLILILSGIGYVAWTNLKHGEADTAAVFSIFFIVTAFMNLTQSWLMSGSFILVLLGACSSHIISSWILRRNFFPATHNLLARFSIKENDASEKWSV